jgi:diguanylate cyclase (GGDEF)-like protein
MQKYFRDSVTGLFNQEFYLTQLEHAIERAKRRKDYLFSTIVLCLDPQAKLNCELNDNELNNVLVIIAGRLTRYFRPTDILARLYDETFATLHDDIKQINDAEVICKRILEILSNPYNIRNEPIPLTFSLGVVADAYEYRDPVDILNLAETEMKSVRDSGGNGYSIVAHDEDIEPEMQEQDKNSIRIS